jgi:hypothetical protein
MTAGRRISAGDTFLFKFLISGAWGAGIVALIVAIVRSWMRQDERRLAFLKIGGDVALFAMAIDGVRRCGAMKRVVLTGDSLRVSNFLREITVPLNDVDEIDEIEGKAYRVVVRFRSPTPFGRRIIFSPIGWSFPHPHPIVAELRAAVLAAKRG